MQDFDPQSGYRLGNQKITKSHLPFVAGILLVVGALLIAVGWTNRGNDKGFMERATIVTGRVDEIESDTYDPNSPYDDPRLALHKGVTMYRPKVSFVTKEGRSLIVSGMWQTTPSAYTVGQTVEVAYDPKDILDRRINTPEEVEETSNALRNIGFLLFAPGVGILFYGRRARASLLNDRDILDPSNSRIQ